jgi:hypothetical protein
LFSNGLSGSIPTATFRIIKAGVNTYLLFGNKKGNGGDGMNSKIRLVSMLIVVLGIVSLAVGGVFIGLAIQKNSFVVSSLREQKITLGLTKDQVAKGELVDTSDEALVAANTLATHLKSIAPTFGALTAANPSGKFDPTVASNLTYGQGLTMETSLNLVVLSFGVIQATMATGAALIIIGIAVGATGIVLFKVGKKTA